MKTEGQTNSLLYGEEADLGSDVWAMCGYWNHACACSIAYQSQILYWSLDDSTVMQDVDRWFWLPTSREVDDSVHTAFSTMMCILIVFTVHWRHYSAGGDLSIWSWMAKHFIKVCFDIDWSLISPLTIDNDGWGTAGLEVWVLLVVATVPDHRRSDVLWRTSLMKHNCSNWALFSVQI